MARARARVREIHRALLSASDYLDPIPVKRERQRSEIGRSERRGGEREGISLFVIPTKGESLFTFVIEL